ncbi:hypothetical protein CEXT_566041 [Caerostris extrusa]|uniref:Uncharacterized protein n=1 Tax=Caerostris extrusa TaxID=172846 RepID=A0AAV4YEB3_CAEEX|nr:hypothetical protein CEXT_566041 [Caerostris extrusa]
MCGGISTCAKSVGMESLSCSADPGVSLALFCLFRSLLFSPFYFPSLHCPTVQVRSCCRERLTVWERGGIMLWSAILKGEFLQERRE